MDFLHSHIEPEYLQLPYHNFAHGKYVGEVMRHLNCRLEGIIAGYAHDMGHTGIINSPEDEKRSCDIISRILREKGYEADFIDIVCSYIMATNFLERGNLLCPQHKLIADADISYLGHENYDFFIQNIARFFIEQGRKRDIGTDQIIDFFRDEQPEFFSYLSTISGKKETPFLTQEANSCFPYFSRNVDLLAHDISENSQKVIGMVRDVEKEKNIQAFRASL